MRCCQVSIWQCSHSHASLMRRIWKIKGHKKDTERLNILHPPTGARAHECRYSLSLSVCAEETSETRSVIFQRATRGKGNCGRQLLNYCRIPGSFGGHRSDLVCLSPERFIVFIISNSRRTYNEIHPSPARPAAPNQLATPPGSFILSTAFFHATYVSLLVVWPVRHFDPFRSAGRFSFYYSTTATLVMFQLEEKFSKSLQRSSNFSAVE